MLVFGDHEERAETFNLVRQINCLLEDIARWPAGLKRHSRLVGALIDGGRMLQGVADDAFAAEQQDQSTLAIARITEFVMAIAEAVRRSWRSGFADRTDIGPLQLPTDCPRFITLKQPEGFAFYALYPEAYLDAARDLRLNAPPRVIGIRSIGTALAAAVAAELQAGLPITVRPFGDPYARRVAVSAELERKLLRGNAHYLVVDEGPGLSGSSFAAVADWLMERGVPPANIALLPSHAGPPGPEAPEERQRWWHGAQRVVADFGDRWPQLLKQWCALSLGWDITSIEDVSGGAWRRRRFAAEEEWPPAVAGFERRKFIVEAGGERFLLKFAGLGKTGEAKFQLAQRLYAKGVTPEPVALVHGFLAERWYADALPIAADEKPVSEIGAYIGARARIVEERTPAPGASIERLLEVIRRNLSIEFGEGSAVGLSSRWDDRAQSLEQRARRVPTDNKLDRWEWLRRDDGTLIKTDALDHHQGHDLIGCQDVAWDAAGAIVEFDFDLREQRMLVAVVEEKSGRAVDTELLEFCLLAYPAFRLGQARLATAFVSDEAERERIRRAGARYRACVERAIDRTEVPFGK